VNQKLVVLLVIGALSGASACGTRPQYGSAEMLGDRAEAVSLTSRILYGIVQALDAYGREAGTLPEHLAELSEAGTEDAWGRKLHYAESGLRFEVRSAGPDGRFGTDDDIVATGQVGRNRPCEIRSEASVTRWEEFAPRCAPDSAVRVLPLCPGLLRAGTVVGLPLTDPDGVEATGRTLVAIAWRIEGASRPVGGLLPTLRPVFGAQPQGANWGFRDSWGNSIRYSPRDETFEVRSAGPDQEEGTEDDIVVRGRLGEPSPCEFQMGAERRRCDEPPPPC
jgi:hypothetical protein